MRIRASCARVSKHAIALSFFGEARPLSLDVSVIPGFQKPCQGSAGNKPSTYADGSAFGARTGCGFARKGGLTSKRAREVQLHALQEPLQVGCARFGDAPVCGGWIALLQNFGARRHENALEPIHRNHPQFYTYADTNSPCKQAQDLFQELMLYAAGPEKGMQLFLQFCSFFLASTLWSHMQFFCTSRTRSGCPGVSLFPRNSPGLRLSARMSTWCDNTGAESASNKFYSSRAPLCFVVQRLALLSIVRGSIWMFLTSPQSATTIFF